MRVCTTLSQGSVTNPELAENASKICKYVLQYAWYGLCVWTLAPFTDLRSWLHVCKRLQDAIIDTCSVPDHTLTLTVSSWLLQCTSSPCSSYSAVQIIHLERRSFQLLDDIVDMAQDGDGTARERLPACLQFTLAHITSFENCILTSLGFEPVLAT